MQSTISIRRRISIERLRYQLVSLILFTCVAVAAFTYSFPLAASPKHKDDIPCTSGSVGPGSITQQKCLAQRISGFGGYYYRSPCTVIVYLTDLGQEQAARAILEPIFRKTDPECGARISFDVRKGRYKFTDLSEWSEKARDLLMRNKETRVPGVVTVYSGSPYFENRSFVRV